MRHTSLTAFQELKDDGIISKREEIVLEEIIENPHNTDREMAKRLGFDDPNVVRPRRKGLLDLGLIEDAGKRECSISGKVVHIWQVRTLNKDKLKKREIRIKKCKCDKCGGTGFVTGEPK